jgi:glycosyltransferase involved in cell wall biosynthesis
VFRGEVMKRVTSANASIQKPRILFIYSNDRGKYLADALKENYHLVDILSLRIDSREFFFWTNLLMCTLETVNTLIRTRQFSLMGRKIVMKNLGRRPQFTEKLCSKVKKHINLMSVKSDIVLQWGPIFAPIDVGTKTPFAVVIDNYIDPPNSLTNKDKFRGWETIYDELRFKFEKEIYSKATHIFTLSKWARQGLSNEYGIGIEKIHPIGWGPCKKIEARELPHKERKSILAIGTEYAHKGIDILLRSANYLRDFSIIIVGKDASYDRIIKPSNVRILGLLSDEELISLYGKSELFFIFSEFEPSAHVLWEAQACGCVIIGYDAYGISEVVINGQTGILLKTRNPQIVAENIRLLYQDHSVLKKMQRAAIDNYVKNGTWDKVCANISANLVLPEKKVDANQI